MARNITRTEQNTNKPFFGRYSLSCHTCLRNFRAKRAHAKYCTTACRMKAFRAKQPKRSMDEITLDRLETKGRKVYELECQNCGKAVHVDGMATASRYCSNACKQAAYRTRQKQLSP